MASIQVFNLELYIDSYKTYVYKAYICVIKTDYKTYQIAFRKLLQM